MLNLSWNKPKLQHCASNVLALISRANKISFCVASFILWQPQHSGSSKRWKQFVDLFLFSFRKSKSNRKVYQNWTGNNIWLFLVENRFDFTLKHLRELNSFNTLMAVIAGLNISAGIPYFIHFTILIFFQVSRLKHTWDLVSKQSKEVLFIQLIELSCSSFDSLAISGDAKITNYFWSKWLF